VKRLTSQKGFSQHIVEKANAVLFTFGSYRLGVTPSFSALLFYRIHLIPSGSIVFLIDDLIFIHINVNHAPPKHNHLKVLIEVIIV
jgi:hypothetical protein